ncbi:unnamed protein product, partial [Brassica oleracea]|uniref:Uncharacterized protein n=1 Tax=Brassica oleracea TaxID=3712 RepID=A0A3P6G6T1_BRAOL|nr:unnamed protein product [Brassica oleracea]
MDKLNNNIGRVRNFAFSSKTLLKTFFPPPIPIPKR